MTPAHLIRSLTAATPTDTPDGQWRIVPLPFGEARIRATPAALAALKKHAHSGSKRFMRYLGIDPTPKSTLPPKEFCLEWGTPEAAETAARQLQDIQAYAKDAEHPPAKMVNRRDSGSGWYYGKSKHNPHFSPFIAGAVQAWRSGTGNRATDPSWQDLIDFFERRAAQAQVIQP